MSTVRDLGDDGFTLIEIILAMFIVVAVMTTVLGLVVSALGTLAQSRQRQSGSALATEAIESLRALPYATVTAGAPGGCNTSLGLAATSTYVTTVGLAQTFTPPATVLSVPAEVLVVNSQSPCQRTTVQGNTTYTVRQYVTQSTTTDAYNLTSIASWTKHGGATTYSAERSTTFSPGGCLVSTLHPFSGPCQSAFSGRAGSDSFNLTVTQLDPTDTSIVGPLIGSLGLPAVSSSLEVEQTVALMSTGIGAGAQDALGSGVVTSRVLEANSDPTSGSTRNYSQSYTIAGGSLSPTPAAFSASSSSASLNGDVAASGAVCTLPTATGTVQIATGPAGEFRPCSAATISGPGNATATLSSNALLTASGISGSAGAANVVGVSTPGICGAAAPGCAHSSVKRAVDVLTFAPVVGPSGLWEISNLKEFAVSEAGASATSPPATRSGTLKLWNGTAYAPLVTLSGTTEGTWTWGTAAGSTYPPITVGTTTISGSLTITRAGSTASGPANCLASACVSTQKSGSIAGSFQVTSPGSAYRVDLALGGVSAISAYQAAPVG
ncbi:prepilin-type N-terminal cleavage/methylation domain-containing protein [Cellulomonas sp. WB94]|uniref:type IV pilus modification PilV family protein n=1 Tax=Cellulomonas sp. WB94 TaxID=2173174 RepID=UPI0011B20E87|nr:prepilin-type N-terminal cleavage/methylation domain-containing protein [Cellulomonas sp. WB94]